MQANVENPGDLTSVLKPVNIASVRAASLRTCGLRAAARAASSRAMSSNQKTGLSSAVSKASSTNLSYTNSLEPGENSQLNAFAMVDKLVDLNAGFVWQTPETSKAAEQSCVQGSQSIKGLQFLARSADMKNRQGKLVIYDWMDSQSDDTEKVASTSVQPKQCADKKEEYEALMSDMSIVKNLSSTLVMAGKACSKKQGSFDCQMVLAGSAKGAKEGSTNFDCLLFNAISNKGVEKIGNYKLHDSDANHPIEEAEFVDIGSNTQIAVEAMDIMRLGALGSSPCDKKTFAFDIGNDTQIAIDAMDILRYDNEPNVISLNEEKGEKNKGQRRQDLGEVSKTNQIEELVQANAVSLPSKKRGLSSRSTRGSKPVGKTGFSRGASKISKRAGKAGSLKSAGPDFNNNKRFLLEFSSAMVPRRKRSRLCSPRVSLNENNEAFGWKKSGRPLYDPHREDDKHDNAEARKSALWQGNNTELAVLTESTNEEFSRRTKRAMPSKPDCDTLLEQSRKRRKCEFRSIFVLFSHSLSEATIKQQMKMLKKLGGHVATSAAKATHFVADFFVRSKNMLEIMGAGKVVVTTNWLEGCSQAEYFVDEESYILKDSQKEKEWGFCMHSSLAASRRKPLLKGMKVVVSPNTVPDFTAMKAIIESAGGQVLQKPLISRQSKPDEIASISFILASDEDYDFCVEYIGKGCKIYSTELVLHGVVLQSLDFSRNRLFVD